MNFRVETEQGLPTPEIEGSQVKELVAIRCIADDSAADHGHKRCDSPPQALFSQALCVPDIPASQPSSEVPVRPTSPCLLLAPRRRAAPSRDREGALRHVSVNARSETCCDGAWWVLWATLHQRRRLRAVTLVSCGRFSVPHRVPSPCRLTWTGVCLSSVFANFADDTQIFFTYRLGG